MLQVESDMKVVGEAKNAIEVFEKIKNLDCQIVISDLNMPGRSGLEMIKYLKIIKPYIRILILSINSEEKYAMRVIKEGANGYISKDAALSELIIAIRKIYSCGKYLSPSLIELLANDACTEKILLPHELLTNREFEIMCKIASGIKVYDIARELCLSISTVHTHRSHIFNKMDIKTNIGLTYYAMDARLID
jgi:DNA-binding NarL/FixJ family response regulator